MADICIAYLSEDEPHVEQLVTLLRQHWSVWWAGDIVHGDWEEQVRAEIPKSSAFVPVLSKHAKGGRKVIIKDEMRIAKTHKRPILPFLIGPAEIPIGFGDLNHTEAHGWVGDDGHTGYQRLKEKISAVLSREKSSSKGLQRLRELKVRDKELRLPAFIFSLSSHETQVNPNEGTNLLRLLEPGASLVSAYDAYKLYDKDRKFHSNIKKICQSDSVLFLDSGNYEAYRKEDRYSWKKNPEGWRQKHFRDVAARLSPDLSFSFDSIGPEGDFDTITEKITKNYRADDRALRERDFPLCPIIHLPDKYKGSLAECAARIVSAVANDLDPLMLAIPERELGDGLMERVKTVRDIRRSLNTLGKYYPLHLLGTGNPFSIIALAAAGADSFDGLEWCRTVVDYESWHLFHFQHFDFFSQTHLHQVKDPSIRYLIESGETPYSTKTLIYNIDFFNDWTRTMQDMIQSGQVESLLKMVPNIGSRIYMELNK
jgi:queuine/archaeosine tRNA-ribosyltransferase